MAYPKKYTQFSYDGYEIDQFDNEIRFYYSVDEELFFVHAIQLDLSAMLGQDFPHMLLDHAVFTLGMAELLNYYKAFCCPEITIKAGYLTQEQLHFWTNNYLKGLGEFFYQNNIDFRNLFKLTCSSQKGFIAHRLISQSEKALVGIGGGKDSLVTGQICQENKIDFAWFSLITHIGNFKANTSEEVLANRLIDVSGNPTRFVVHRVLDEQLRYLNEQGAYNGHVPISMVFALVCVIVSIVEGYKTIYMSNERSANIGSVNYLGMEINHQYSKSFEFEQNLHTYIKRFISPDIRYVSFLRPFYELQIAQIFSHLKKYHLLAISCNKGMREGRWCLHCPKCLFVFVMMHAFLNEEEVTKMFGANLYKEEILESLFLELLGLEKIKPFECVGTFEEVRSGMYMALKWYDKNNLPVILQMYMREVYAKTSHIKETTEKILTDFDDQNCLNKKEIEILKKYV